MQLLPSTAAAVAKREGLPWRGAADLEQPALNIRLGTRYLAERRDRYDGRLWLAAAAYNAGPAPVERWLDARPDLPPDLWSETVTYRETREYISRLMAFSVIYDWRLGGELTRVSTRFGLARPGGSTRTEVICPAPVAMTSHPSVDRSSS
jgi:soluble lytic murein transglycosylase